ncbi:MAG TPA: threonine aldolase family protein, partial [Vicinamibacterales bacterium]|nr:threonine aldolase family protein [Vicinamibacterales bacterium]
MSLPIDLRSDTVTRPTPSMREAIAAAPVGDDQFGEDPTVNALQERVAALLGKEAALWLPTGTMANQVALRVMTRPGDHVLVSRESHAVWHETGGAGANAGVQLTEIGTSGVFTAEEFLAARNPRGHMLLPPTTVVEIENTHNRSGGIVFPQDEAQRICAVAREHGVASYLDGARLWNAAVASGRSPAQLASPFDLVSVALSKGLGAPGGSLLAGTRALIDAALRHRRMLGGAMRQVGIFAAAGLYALDHHLSRLAEDHDNAARIARRLVESPRILLSADTVQTNVIVFSVAPDAPDAPTIVARARERGVLVIAFGPRTIRLVTHLDV